MPDAIILDLSFLFAASIVFWAISAYAEMMVYRTLHHICGLIQTTLTDHREIRGEDPTDYCMMKGRYKNRSVICRINRIDPRTLWNYKLNLHCHLEPLRRPLQDQRHDVAALGGPLNPSGEIYYPSSSTTLTRFFWAGKRVYPADILAIFEDLTRAAEMIENRTSP
jgi:hypothetical protein